jgi:dipeptidyl aminopeptidase/acylaminoacyl peptidase
VLFPGSRRFAYVRETGTAPAPDKPGYSYLEVQIFVKRLSEGAAAPGRPLFGPKAFFVTGLSVTPTGRRIVFAGKRRFGPSRSKGHDFEIYSVAAAGGDVRRLTDDNYRDTDPEVPPDGSQIAFARRVHGRAQIFVMDRAGAHQRRLTEASPRAATLRGWRP